MNNEELVIIPDENILMSFYIDNQEYVVLAKTLTDEENDIYFAKREHLNDGNYILRNIEYDEEYNSVLAKYESLIALMEGDNNEMEEE